MRYIRAAHDSGSGNLPINRVVIHATVSPCERGGAVNIANYFASPSSGGSAHYVVDPGQIVRCLPDNIIGWHAPPNSNSIGVELTCTLANEGKGHWGRANHQAMLRLAAKLVHDECRKHDIPMRKIGPRQLRRGVRGICGHDDVRDAWQQTTHWDPGPHFPWGQFIEMVRNAGEPVDNRTDVEKLLDSMNEKELRKIIRQESRRGVLFSRHKPFGNDKGGKDGKRNTLHFIRRADERSCVAAPAAQSARDEAREDHATYDVPQHEAVMGALAELRKEVREAKDEAVDDRVTPDAPERVEVRSRLDKMDERFDKMDERFDRIEDLLQGKAA